MMAIVPLVLTLTASPGETCGISFVAGRSPQAPPVAMMWAGYGTLRNDSGHAVTITSVSSHDFAMAEIHETREEGGVERMRRIDPLTVPAGAQIQFAPRGRHLMLMRPTHDLEATASLVVEFHIDACKDPITATLPIQREK